MKISEKINKKSLKNNLAAAAIFFGGVLLNQDIALADSCPAIIAGSSLAAEVCDFDSGTGSNLTISSGATLGGSNLHSYAAGSFTNNGTITSDSSAGLDINDGSLSAGLVNNGTITTVDQVAIGAIDSSSISSGITNAGTISTQNNAALYFYNGTTISGGINNSGSITNNSNDTTLTISTNITINGNITNSGTIRGYGSSNAINIGASSSVTGNITNSGSIRNGNSGLGLDNNSTIGGNITNSGSIRGDNLYGIAITNSSTVSGNITNSGTISGGTHGILVDSATVSGAITNESGGAISGSSNGISIISSTITGALKNYGTITGSTKAIEISSDSTISSINLYENSITNGAIDAVSSALNIYGGTVNGTISADTINIMSGSSFTMGYNMTAADKLTNAGTLNLGTASKSLTAANGYAQSTGGVFKISAQNTSTYGQLTVDNGVDLSQSGAINVNILSNANIVVGNTLSNIISGSVITPPTSGFSVTDNSRLLNFSAAISGSGVNLTAVDDSSTSISKSVAAMGDSGSAGAASKLDEIISSNQSGDFQNIIGALNTLGSDQDVANAVSQTAPALAGATNAATIENTNTTLRIIQARQDSNLGLSSGEDFSTNRNFWLKTFGSWENQNNKNGVTGYDSKTSGLVIGADNEITDVSSLGFGVSYFSSKLKSNNASNRVNSDNILGIIYGSHTLDNKTEINAQIAAGYSRIHSNRDIRFANLNRVAEANYNGWNLHAGAGVSRLVKLNKNTIIMPQIRTDYFITGNESYDESGAGALNLQIASQSQSQLIPAFETRTNHNLTQKFSFALNAGLGYDLMHNNNSTSASFAGGGGTFTTHGIKPSPWIIRSGLGLTWKQNDNLDLTARYDRRDRGTSYDNQTISLKLRVMF